ncbi:hypothetical protein [Halobacteriovorax sp. HLS]|uniref:hypothetical protein n=1 Tax=Halobacteriovorax sp. HLS TaxID=2234000 RepID=UPI000FD8E750|nr:hypothetical protein [Halobacteriovorax sp. HLS]
MKSTMITLLFTTLLLSSCSSHNLRSPAQLNKPLSCKEAVQFFFSQSKRDLYDRFVGKLHTSQIIDTEIFKLQGRKVSAIEEVLETAAIKEIDLTALGNSGSTKPTLVILSDGTKAVWKPHKRIKLSNYRAEVLAYELDVKFGFGLVPPTVVRTIDGDIGSLQLFKEGTAGVLLKYHRDNELLKNPTRLELDLKKQTLFDYLLLNNDRNVNNYLFDSESRIISIDNASSFTGHGYKKVSLKTSENKIKDFLNTKEGQKILLNLKKSLTIEFEEEVISYLGHADASLFFERINHVIALANDH